MYVCMYARGMYVDGTRRLWQLKNVIKKVWNEKTDC